MAQVQELVELAIVATPVLSVSGDSPALGCKLEARQLTTRVGQW